MDKNAIRVDLLRANPMIAETVVVMFSKERVLFVCEFVIRAVDSFVVASTARENNATPGVCCSAEVWKARRCD